MKRAMKGIFNILLSIALVLGLMPGMSKTAYADTSPVTTEQELRDFFQQGGSVTLGADITISGSSLTVFSGKTVTLNLDGHTIKNDSLDVTIYVDGNLTINGSGIIENNYNNDIHSVVVVENGGTLNVDGASITSSREPEHTMSGITVRGTLNFKSGSIQLSGSGRALYLVGGTANITDGTFRSGENVWAINNSNINISGGSFNNYSGTGTGVLETDNSKSIVLTGGYYPVLDSSTNQYYLPDDYAFVDSDNRDKGEKMVVRLAEI